MMEFLMPLVWLGVKIAGALGIIFTIAPVLTLLERRVSAWIQGRKGPNRCGPQGTLQPIADVMKFILKEEVIPEGADRWLFVAGPLLVFVPPTLGFCAIPYGNSLWGERLQIANLNIGLLFIMSVLSVGVYGVALGGWASNNKYSLLGSLRASAQVISYELTLGLTILLVIMMTSSGIYGEAGKAVLEASGLPALSAVDPQTIVWNQVVHGWNIFGGNSWWTLPSGVVAFIMFFTCALAENNRLPFDMSECESELVGGYHTEYSSMKFAMFFLGEYIAMILMSSIMVTLFFGGWDIPFLTLDNQPTLLGAILSVGSFSTKIFTFLMVYMWIRWTLPRFKYNQVMDLGWKAFLPISLANIAAVAAVGVLLLG